VTALATAILRVHPAARGNGTIHNVGAGRRRATSGRENASRRKKDDLTQPDQPLPELDQVRVWRSPIDHEISLSGHALCCPPWCAPNSSPRAASARLREQARVRKFRAAGAARR